MSKTNGCFYEQVFESFTQLIHVQMKQMGIFVNKLLNHLRN